MKILKNELKSELNIRTEKNFPKERIEFIDIMPLIIQKETFKEILQHINIVSEEMTNVSAVTEEVNSGSSMLLEAIISINDIAGEVTQKTEDGLHASNDQKQMVTNIMNQVEELNAISSEIQASINAFII